MIFYNLVVRSGKKENLSIMLVVSPCNVSLVKIKFLKNQFTGLKNPLILYPDLRLLCASKIEKKLPVKCFKNRKYTPIPKTKPSKIKILGTKLIFFVPFLIRSINKKTT